MAKFLLQLLQHVATDPCEDFIFTPHAKDRQGMANHCLVCLSVLESVEGESQQCSLKHPMN